MQSLSFVRKLGMFTVLAAISTFSAKAQEIKTVFVIAMENHNWTQPANQFTGTIQQIYQNPNAPFINSLVNGTAFEFVGDSVVHISEQVSYASAYHNVLATPNGNNPDIHPSEPNYIWAEAGTNFGVLNDNDPFSSKGVTNQNTSTHLSNFLTQAGKTWKSYQEDIDLTSVNGQLTNVPLPQDQWTVPLASFTGSFTSGLNEFNGSAQFNYAAKHNPMVFFTELDHPESIQRYAYCAGSGLQGPDRRCGEDSAGRRLSAPGSPHDHGFGCLTRTTVQSLSGSTSPKMMASLATRRTTLVTQSPKLSFLSVLTRT